MKELQDHLQLLCQMMQDDNSNFHCFLQRVKKKSEQLNQFPYGLLLKRDGLEEESDYWRDRNEKRLVSKISKMKIGAEKNE